MASARAPDGQAVAFLVILFLASRLAAIALGLRFETGPLKVAVQSIDPQLMRDHLLQSLWYLHGQPPLWNALVGASLDLFPGHWAELWHLAFLGLGLVEILALFALLLELGLPRRAALAIDAAFMLTPAVFAYENSFFYDYPTLVLLTVTALALVRFVSRPGFGRGLLLFAAAACPVLLRTLFQIYWLLAVVVLVLVVCRGRRRVVLVSSALPLALVFGVYLKNWILYDVPASSSWAGMGLARIAVQGLPPAERRRLVREGKLHRVSLVKPLSPLGDYEAVGIEPDPPTGIPLLDEVSGPEFPANLENRTYIRISRLYWQDDLWVVRHRPGAYLRAVGHAVADFFSAPTRSWNGTGHLAKLRGYDRWFNDVVYPRFGVGKVGLLGLAAFVFALLVGLRTTLGRLRPGADGVSAAIAFATLTIVYVGLQGNLAELGENYRFAFVVDPLVLSLVAVGARGVLVRARRGHARGSAT